MIILITWRKEFAQSVSNHQQEKIFYFMYPFYFLFAICYIPLFVSAFLNQDNYHLINLIFILLISLNFNFMTYFWVIRPIREAFQISNFKFQISNMTFYRNINVKSMQHDFSGQKYMNVLC
jgi:hypothetical protein